jgi:hypothetical protein
MQVYLNMLLGLILVRELRKQNWAEGEVEL